MSSLAWHTHPFTARTTFGARLSGDTTDILEQYVYFFGVWEPNLTAWLTRRLSEGDVFVDVGANVGYYSLLASQLVGATGAVVAVEASPSIFARLTRNLVRNRSNNVRAINVAAVEYEHSVPVFLASRYHSGVTSTHSDSGLKLEAEVPGLPLSSVLTQSESQRARVVKIDVEGDEWASVAGLVPLLDESRPDLEVIVEVSPQRLAKQRRSPEDLVGLFADAGFHAYRLVNYYHAEGYIQRGRPQPPTKLVDPIERETDLVFSRLDEEVL